HGVVPRLPPQPARAGGLRPRDHPADHVQRVSPLRTTMSESPIQLQSRSEITRREALQLFGAGLAVLQAGCLERPGEEIRPSVRRPEFNPGTPLLYATSMVLDGFATGLLVEAHGGRPTKIEGNPAHPA